MSPGPIVDQGGHVLLGEGSTSQTPTAKILASEEWVTLDRKRDTAPDRVGQRIQSIHRSLETKARDYGIGELLALTP